MKLKKRDASGMDVDMTPMIDVTFQLISFFMFVLNFSEAEVDERVQLPSSVLAKPPEGVPDTMITIQVTKAGSVILGGQVFQSADGIKPLLNNEKYLLETKQKTVADASVIIRAHREAQTGEVQKVIRICQEGGFERFTLRAKEKVN